MFHTFSAAPQSSEIGELENGTIRSLTTSSTNSSPIQRMHSSPDPHLSSPQRQSKSPMAPVDALPRSRPRTLNREPSVVQVQQTLTVCTRCRQVSLSKNVRVISSALSDWQQRKIKCDPGLPRCSPCEKANAQCEYFDVTKRTVVSRKYVVWLQHKIQELERE